ncbi:MAG TPA: M48 family metallopeptidase [Myxococcaceae bacterium]|jgi:Zn-dependent protease with chaperone function
MRHTVLVLRAVVALVLMILFFTLALAVSAGLLYGAYELGAFTIGHVRGRGIIFLLLVAGGMGFGGLTVLWSILPRIDKFVPPGPELSDAEQPALFKEIRRVAAMVGQQPPAHVYLAPDVNAFVTERGGWMGIGSRRVMGVGLGLMNLLTVSELRAVLAHEFGHFDGGDTKLGPWIYKTRGAIIRTVQNLFRAGAASADSDLQTVGLVLTLIGKPFHWFAKLYLRITHAISRAQEYSADRLAATTQGAQALVEGLKKAHRGGLAFGVYLRTELAPLLGQKRQPPLGEGFRRFLTAEVVAEGLTKAEAEELAEGKQDPYDTHPPLRERIRNVEALGASGVKDDPRPAVELLADVPALEAKLCAAWTEGATLTPIRWEESAAAHLPGWKEAQANASRGLQGITPLTLPVGVGVLRSVAEKVLQQPVGQVPDDDLRDWAIGLYAGALSALLMEHGFTPRSGPGEPFRFSRGDVALEPYTLVRHYLRGELKFEEWSAQWTAAGLEHALVAPAREKDARAAAP